MAVGVGGVEFLEDSLGGAGDFRYFECQELGYYL